MRMRHIVSVTVSTVLLLTLSGVAHADYSASPPETEIPETITQASISEGINTSLNVKLATLDDDIATSPKGQQILISDSNGKAVVSGNSSSLVIEDSDGPTIDTDNQRVATVDSAESSNVDYAITATAAGNVRVYSVIGDRQSPERYSYTFPGVESIVLDSETGIAFLFSYVNGNPQLVGGVDAPWARDANGLEVPTHFEAHGNTLIQVIEHKSGHYAYPITADPSWWDNVKNWFKGAGSWVANKAKSAAKWLGPKAKWLSGKTWSGTKRIVGKGRVVAKKVGPAGIVLCAVGSGWAWYRSDASGWVRVGDAVVGCFV
ncbi:hypothetical protein [Cutibacterium sp.]|uniref:hypothetical protein n=1 Tax=Cutibacterium sp. TaxID=1912221 RepID=UPI0026DC909F|nr:hypothetical protein [Cutibacterium sp.]MDO4411825.1 hypothetical protein [Cutibacterium sp.]